MRTIHIDAEFVGMELKKIPYGNIDKTVCACGMTTLALENDVNTIIVEPTVNLCKNKRDQYPNERTDNKVLAVWGDTTPEQIEKYTKEAKTVKIISTYDSIHKVKHLLPECHLIVDESQKLLSLAKERPDALRDLLEIAEEYKDKLSLISATPTPLKYLPPWVTDLEQIKLVFKNTMKTTPILCERKLPYKSLREEFIAPLYKNKTLTIAERTFSKIIVFINTVKQVVEIIEALDIDKNECGIICGDSLKNDVQISGIRRLKIGMKPMFTFVTSSGFEGIDIYNEEAMTIVVSNTSRKWQMIDMLTDLKQAISRQRIKTNPNYGCYIYIYNQSVFTRTEEQLMSLVEKKRKKILKNIETHKRYKSENDEDCFITDADFDAYTLKRNGYFELNEQAFNNDVYFIQELRNQYTKGFEVAGLGEETVIVKPVILERSITYKDLVGYFKEHNVKGVIEWGSYSTRTDWIRLIELSYKYYSTVWENYTYAKEKIENHGDEFEQIRIDIRTKFAVGNRYSRNEVKNKLQTMYHEKKLNRCASHQDLLEVFHIQEIKVRGERMVHIISRL